MFSNSACTNIYIFKTSANLSSEALEGFQHGCYFYIAILPCMESKYKLVCVKLDRFPDGGGSLVKEVGVRQGLQLRSTNRSLVVDLPGFVHLTCVCHG